MFSGYSADKLAACSCDPLKRSHSCCVQADLRCVIFLKKKSQSPGIRRWALKSFVEFSLPNFERRTDTRDVLDLVLVASETRSRTLGTSRGDGTWPTPCRCCLWSYLPRIRSGTPGTRLSSTSPHMSKNCTFHFSGTREGPRFSNLGGNLLDLSVATYHGFDVDPQCASCALFPASCRPNELCFVNDGSFSSWVQTVQTFICGFFKTMLLFQFLALVRVRQRRLLQSNPFQRFACQRPRTHRSTPGPEIALAPGQQ